MIDIRQQIAANRQDVQDKVDQVRSNPHLSDEGKRQRIAALYTSAMERHNVLLERHRAEQEKKLEDLHNALFAPKFTISMANFQIDSLRREFRKSLSEADKVLSDGGVEGLQRYLEMAQLSGDSLAARATFAVAHNRNYEPVVEAYLDAFPEERATYEEYQNLDRQTRNPNPADLLAQSFELAAPPRPPEIHNYRLPTDGEPELVASDRFFRGIGELHG